MVDFPVKRVRSDKSGTQDLFIDDDVVEAEAIAMYTRANRMATVVEKRRMDIVWVCVHTHVCSPGASHSGVSRFGHL